MGPTDVDFSPGVRKVWDEIQARQKRLGHAQLGVYHCLAVLLELFPDLIAEVSGDPTIRKRLREVQNRLEAGDIGPPLDPEGLRREVCQWAATQGKRKAYERDLAAVVLQKAGWTPTAVAGPTPAKPSTRQVRPTPTLDRLARDLCQEARAGRLAPVVGREAVLRAVIETLCRRIKRNVALVGPAGVGKTAIVEGLAQRIVRGEVPEPLRDARVLALSLTSLVAGANYGGFFQRVEDLLREAAQAGVIVFIDEAHLLMDVGYGRAENLANLLKGPLSRGQMACIIATTEDEYRRFIQKDRALDRRFQPVRVDEPDEAELRLILESHARDMATQKGISIAPAVLETILDLSKRLLRHRYFPDKALDVLDQSVAAALQEGLSKLDSETVRRTVCRLAGLPLDWEARLQALEAHLIRQTLIPEADVQALVRRLPWAFRGLDMRPHRPNAVVLVIHPEAHDGGLAYALAVNLFGSPDRLLEEDLGLYIEHHQISQLLGAPPGYVGYEQELLLHRLLYAPASVLLFKNVDSCHPVIRSVLAQALRDGYFTDAQGRRLFIGDAIVVLTARPAGGPSRRLGFRPDASASPAERGSALRDTLGPALAEQIDQVIVLEAPTPARVRQWLEAGVLDAVARRYKAQGVELVWGPSLIEWLASQADEVGWRVSDWERRVEGEVLPFVWAAWSGEPAPSGEEPVRLWVDRQGDRIVVRREPSPQTDASSGGSSDGGTESTV